MRRKYRWRLETSLNDCSWDILRRNKGKGGKKTLNEGGEEINGGSDEGEDKWGGIEVDEKMELW